MDIQLELDIKDTHELSDEAIYNKYHDFVYSSVNYDSYVWYDDLITRDYICPKCHKKIKDNKCIKCNTTYNLNKRIRYNKKDKFIYQEKLIFDVRDYNLYLYLIHIDKNIENNQINTNIRKYLVSPDSIINLDNNKIFMYSTYVKAIKHYNSFFANDDWEKWDEYIHSEYSLGIDDVYMINIDEVSNYPLLEHSCLKESIEYMIENNIVMNISNIILDSICYKEREYLFKLGLKRLAVTYPFGITYKRGFKNTFGIDKSYLPLMVENDIDTTTYIGMKEYPTKDLLVADFIGCLKMYSYSQSMDLIKSIGYKKVAHYCKGKDLYMYEDYISMANKLGMNIKDKKVAFPEDLVKSHDELVYKYEDIKNKKYDNKLNEIAKLCEINIYVDEDYIILPAKSVAELIDESKQMNNCVRTYVEMIASGHCQIYFMRKKMEPRKSLVTIEVVNNKVVQARIKNNKDCPNKYKTVIDLFEKQLKIIKVNN